MQVFKNSDINACFALAEGFPADYLRQGRFMMFIWNSGQKSIQIHVDDRIMELPPHHIFCTTYLHKVRIDNSAPSLKTLLFNREFYCVHTYDSEVSCNGLLFFGSNTSPVLKLGQDETRRLQTLFSVLKEEFGEADTNQEEMLRILLKRLIIRCTRLAKKQLLKQVGRQSDIDLIRNFNVLVEQHFKTKKTVVEYAELLYKSPKTITNVFSRYSQESPLQVIHNRVMMEAKQMLYYTEKSAKEIGFDLGYNDPAQFSKLFKRHTGLTPSQFKKQGLKI